jgi:hypothetical protein
MADLTPIAVSDRNAARMLDMPTAEFLRLVSVGSLPGPVLIGGHDRWIVDDLRAIVRGDAARPQEAPFEL